MRKLRVEQQESRIRSGVRSAVYTLQYASKAVRERSSPIHSRYSLPSAMRSRMRPEVFVIRLQQHRRRGGALDIAAHLDELPALAVAHRGIVTPWNWCTASITCCRNSVGCSVLPSARRLHRCLHLRPRDLQIEAVQPLPLLGGDLLAHLARILARRR